MEETSIIIEINQNIKKEVNIIIMFLFIKEI